MDSFEKCRLSSEKMNWNFQEVLRELEFDFSKQFLPKRVCGMELPEWVSPYTSRKLNHLRGYSYAHIFLFVEEFIIMLTLSSVNKYLHTDSSAFSAMLRFTEEEAKHQRMFILMKEILAKGLGFQPAEIPNHKEVAQTICNNSAFSVYLLTLALELLTQRHFIECFNEEANQLDPGFVKIFRLHWIEEVQHTRLDILELKNLAEQMSEVELCNSIVEFVDMLHYLKKQLVQQNILDVKNLETMLEHSYNDVHRQELFQALNKEFLWTFIISGLNHEGFQGIYKKLIPSKALQLPHIITLIQEDSKLTMTELSGLNPNHN